MPDTLYILDDEADYAEMLAEYAGELDWVVMVKNSCADFIESGIPEKGVLVLDLIMPDMDGIEMIQAIAKAEGSLSLILISGFDHRVLESARLLAQAHDIQVHGCLEKPVDLSMFGDLLKKARQEKEANDT